MKERVLVEKYLISELKVSGDQLLLMMGKIKKYADIYAEFCEWLKNRNYDFVKSVTVAGYTARQLVELNPKFNGIAAWNFLVDLRENPNQAKKFIQEGFRM